METAKLLSPPHNYAVIQLPGRHYPGVVFQGDSLNTLITSFERALAEHDPSEKNGLLQEVLEQLRAVRSGYEATLQQEGIRLPYFRGT